MLARISHRHPGSDECKAGTRACRVATHGDALLTREAVFATVAFLAGLLGLSGRVDVLLFSIVFVPIAFSSLPPIALRHTIPSLRFGEMARPTLVGVGRDLLRLAGTLAVRHRCNGGWSLYIRTDKTRPLAAESRV